MNAALEIQEGNQHVTWPRPSKIYPCTQEWAKSSTFKHPHEWRANCICSKMNLIILPWDKNAMNRSICRRTAPLVALATFCKTFSPPSDLKSCLMRWSPIRLRRMVKPAQNHGEIDKFEDQPALKSTYIWYINTKFTRVEFHLIYWSFITANCLSRYWCDHDRSVRWWRLQLTAENFGGKYFVPISKV